MKLAWLKGRDGRVIIFSVVICVIAILSIIMVYVLPLATIRILTCNPHEEEAMMRVYLDGSLKAEIIIPSTQDLVVSAEWHVPLGWHVVTIDSGMFFLDDTNSTELVWRYDDPDGLIDRRTASLLFPLYEMEIEWCL